MGGLSPTTFSEASGQTNSSLWRPWTPASVQSFNGRVSPPTFFFVPPPLPTLARVQNLGLTPVTASTADSESESEARDSEATEPEGHRLWCRCGNCIVMPTVRECVCCQEVAAIQYRIPTESESLTCITRNPSFTTVVLDREVLDVTLLLLKDLRAESLKRPINSR